MKKFDHVRGILNEVDSLMIYFLEKYSTDGYELWS